MKTNNKRLAIIPILFLCALFFSACNSIQINANAQGSTEQGEGLNLDIQIEEGGTQPDQGMKTVFFTIFGVFGLVIMASFVVVLLGYGGRRSQ